MAVIERPLSSLKAPKQRLNEHGRARAPNRFEPQRGGTLRLNLEGNREEQALLIQYLAQDDQNRH